MANTVEFICTAKGAQAKLRGSAMPGILDEANAALVGRKIVRVGYLLEFGSPVPCVELDDGTLITTQSDDEGNGPGVLSIENIKTGLHTLLCETRRKF